MIATWERLLCPARTGGAFFVRSRRVQFGIGSMRTPQLSTPVHSEQAAKALPLIYAPLRGPPYPSHRSKQQATVLYSYLRGAKPTRWRMPPESSRG
jgi:hypothetical protein